MFEDVDDREIDGHGDSLITELIMLRSMLGFGFIIICNATMGEGVMWTQILVL